MSTCVMKRLTVWAYAADADAVTKRLVRSRCVDVDVLSPETDKYLAKYDPSARIRECESRLAGIESAMEPLYPYSKKKGGLAAAPAIKADREAFAADRGGVRSDAAAAADRINGMTKRLGAIERELADCASKMTAAKPWLGCGFALDTAGTARTRLFFGSMPLMAAESAALDTRLDGLAAAWRIVGKDPTAAYVMFVAENADADELLRRLNSAGFVRAVFPDGCGSAEDIMNVERERTAALNTEREDIKQTLCGLAGRLDDLRLLWDTVSTELVTERVKEKMLATGSCVLLRGWVPAKRAEKLGAALEELGCAYEFCDPEPGDDVPVKLENNRFASCFEWVVAMYSLPAYGTFDPTFIMSFFYVLFFAMMFADVGYGLLLAVGGFLIPRLLHMKPEKAAPFRMFAFCGIGSIITGVLFGGYFGDMPLALIRAFNPEAELPSTLAIVVDPVAEPTTFLLIALALGFVHLVAGQAIKFSIVWKASPVDAICDYALFWALYGGLIMLIIVPSVGKWIAIGAAAAIVLTGGRKEKNILMRIPKGFLALYGIVSFGSDILSYSRILALALSGSVLAQVMNILGTMGSSPISVVVGMIFVFIVGHTINLALSTLGSFVHTSRLQYIEFFGKFYEDGGRPYAPAEPSERYSDYDMPAQDQIS